MRVGDGLRLGCAALLLNACGGSEGFDGAREADEPSASLSESSEFRPLLERIRDYGAEERLGRKQRAPALSGLTQTTARSFRRVRDRLQPVFGDAGAAESRVDIAPPARADEALALGDKSSGLRLSASLRGMRAVEARAVDGLLVYPEAGNERQTVIHRPLADGTEDYISFEHPPTVAEVAYDVALASNVAGLRLVSNTLEFLDGSGAPRLRVAPPYLVDASGAVHTADLTVEGCHVDRDATEPWGRVPVAPGAADCTLRVTWEGAAVQYPAVLDPAWTSTANMSAARANHTAVVLPNGRVLVAGGSNASGTAARSTAEIFDPASRTWAATGQMTTARAEHTATLRNDGRIAVIGGWNLTASHRSAELYNPNTGTWAALPQMQTARRRHTATLLQNGSVLVTGGRATNAPVASAERLSSASTWSSGGTMLAPQEGHTATAMSTGRVLIVGPNAPTAQLYNPANGAWTATSSAPDARQFHSASALSDGSVLVAGGINGVKSAERYNPNTDSWMRVGSLSNEHSAHGGVRLTTGRVLVVGGPNATARTATEIFDPTWGTWVPGPAVGTPRSAHASVSLNDGKVLVSGGLPSGTNTATASAELYDPSGASSTVTEYRLPAAVDADVLDDRATELWASLHRPSALSAGRRYPLLVFLHGNHATCGTGSNPRRDVDCTYTETGTCPSGYVVVKSHRGYDYTANELAARGYFVVSVNANRGITCGASYPDDGGLNLARGRLILKHLQKLSAWDRGLEATPSSLGLNLRDRVDFSEVGLMGHSRGGEGIRAAYQQYRDPGSPWPARIGAVGFRGLFEIGPVDGQTSRVLNAEETRWSVLLPACDGDVGDLQGVRPFDRMLHVNESSPAFKSTLHQYGANHNFYNTEWQESDASGCANHRAMFSAGEGVTGSAEQRQTGLVSMFSFFTANVGPSRDAQANLLFDPQFPYAPENPVNRGYHPGGGSAESLVLEDFINPTGTSSYGLENEASGVTVAHTTFSPHANMPGARIDWTEGGPSSYFQTNFAPSGAGFDLEAYQFLDLRVDRAYWGPTVEETSFTVRLVNADGSLSSEVPITDYIQLPIPPRFAPVLQTARIPLARFEAANLANVRGVRLTVVTGETSGIFLANIRATRSTSALEAVAAEARTSRAVTTALPALQRRSAAVSTTQRVTSGNGVEAIRSSADSVEIIVSSSVPFLPKSERLALSVGSERTLESSHPGGHLGRARFVLPREAWDRLANGEPMSVRYGESTSSVEWEFGPVDKSRLDQ